MLCGHQRGDAAEVLESELGLDAYARATSGVTDPAFTAEHLGSRRTDDQR